LPLFLAVSCIMRKKSIGIGVALVILSLSVLNSAGWAKTFFGEIPTGMLELTEFKHPVYLFVPPTYQPAQPYPLLIALPGENMKPAEYAEKWTSFAKRKSVIVLVPTLMISRDADDVPTQGDKWILRLKNEVMSRYQISDRRVFLVGEGTSTAYAAYLGLRYPAEFSGVALLGGAWGGPLEKLTELSSKPERQIPFFVSLAENTDPIELDLVEAQAMKLTNLGYPVYMEKLEKGEDFQLQDFRKRMFEWLETKADRWRDVILESEKSPKEKISVWAKNFFKVN